MKKIFLLVLLTVGFSIQYLHAQYTISGVVSYNNTSSTPLKGCIIYLLQGGDTVNQFTTVSTGQYVLIDVSPGTYTLGVKCTKAYGGTGASDALAILRHFVLMPPLLEGLKLIAADVDNSGYINSADALYCSRRFVGQIISYPSGDWVFEVPTVVVTNSDVIQNFKGLCFGDVNGSYIPSNP